MSGAYFESLVDNSLAVIAAAPESAEIAAVNEPAVYNPDDCGDVNLKLRLNACEVNVGEIEELASLPKIKRVRFLEPNGNECGNLKLLEVD